MNTPSAFLNTGSHQVLIGLAFRKKQVWVGLFIFLLISIAGCVNAPYPSSPKRLDTDPNPKLFIVILDALKRKTLMESIDSLPNFKAVIKGPNSTYPYLYFENVLVSIPSSSKPSNTTLLTGVYPLRHGVPQTLWFDRKTGKVITLTSISQRRTINILNKTDTDTIFDFAHRSGKSSMAVATQVTKGIDPSDWVKQSVHIWGQAFCVNLFNDQNPIPDGAHLDRRTTKGLLNGYLYSFSDGLKGKLRTNQDIPDITVLHYIGMDIFTHYPRRFMVKENWTVDAIQKWYLQNVLDIELGKIIAFLKENERFENTLFFFLADHGQTRIIAHIDETAIIQRLADKFKIMGKRCPPPKADLVVMPGASTKTLYIRNHKETTWMSPPGLLADVKPVVDVLIDINGVEQYLNAILVARYPGERDENPKHSGRSGELDAYWFFNPDTYRQSHRRDGDFLDALEPLARLDELVGKPLKAADMFCKDFSRENIPDIILINKPGYYFTPDKGKYAHHGGIYPDDAYVSFVVAGPGIQRFTDHPRVITRQIDTVDLVPMAAHLVNIKIDKPIDGINRFLEIK